MNKPAVRMNVEEQNPAVITRPDSNTDNSFSLNSLFSNTIKFLTFRCRSAFYNSFFTTSNPPLLSGPSYEKQVHVFLSVCFFDLHNYLLIYLSICQSIYLQSMYLYTYLSIYPPTCCPRSRWRCTRHWCLWTRRGPRGRAGFALHNTKPL